MNTHSRRCIPDILNVCSSRADSRQIILFHRSKGHCSGCTSLLCIVEHRRPTCAVAIHNTCADQQRNRFQNSALVKDQRSMCWQHTINPPKLGHQMRVKIRSQYHAEGRYLIVCNLNFIFLMLIMNRMWPRWGIA